VYNLFLVNLKRLLLLLLLLLLLKSIPLTCETSLMLRNRRELALRVYDTLAPETLDLVVALIS